MASRARGATDGTSGTDRPGDVRSGWRAARVRVRGIARRAIGTRDEGGGMTGVVWCWSPSFGFIEPDDGGPNVFFCGQSCDVRRQDYMLIRRGDRVSFEFTPDLRHSGRVMATDVVCLSDWPAAELHRRAAREGTPDDWIARQRKRRAA